MAHDVFISYSHHDKPTADAIVAKFESEGLRCWYAPRDIAPGEDWAAAIIDGIKDSKVFVIVFTSYSNGSQQVLREIGLAVTRGMPIIPFRMTNTEPSKGMQYYLSTVHWLDAVDGQLWINDLDNTKFKALYASGSIKTQEDFDKLADSLIGNHPETEVLSIQFNEGITDLTKLTEMPNLTTVMISEEMWDAVTSLDHVNYQFELRLPD